MQAERILVEFVSGMFAEILAHLVRRENPHGRVTFVEPAPAAGEPADLKGEAGRPANPGSPEA